MFGIAIRWQWCIYFTGCIPYLWLKFECNVP